MRGWITVLAALLGAFGAGLWLVGVLAQPALAQAQAYKPDPGPYPVEIARYDWQDHQRNRQVPVKIYYPKDAAGPFPLVVFSHGMGGTREGYEYLGQHWASHGYVSLHLQHKGSDSEVFRGTRDPLGAMRQALLDPRITINRPLDVRFAIDQMQRMNQEDTPLKGRLDLDHIGMAGHSFGGWTTLAVAGQVFVLPGGREVSLSDSRVKAAIPMSAPVPARKDQLDKAFGSIRIPCFHMTGTLDDSPVGDTKAEERRIPFDHMSGADQYLVIFNDGDHMIFSGRGLLPALGPGMNGPRAKDALFQNLIRQSSLAFWDAYLRNDAPAKSWLAEGGFGAVLAGDGTFEKKLKAD